MKILLVLVILAVIVLCVLLVVKMVQNAIEGRQQDRSKWHISPRTDEDNNARTLWLVCEGESDFLFYPTEHNATWDWDRAVMEAEVQCQEFNRLKKELT